MSLPAWPDWSAEQWRDAKRQLIAKKYDPNQPRDEQGQWSKTSGRSFTSEEGYQWHEQGPGVTWVKEKLLYADARAISSYSGFTYRQINELRRGVQPTKEAKIRPLTPEEHQLIKNTETGEEVQRLVPPEGREYHYRFSYEHVPKDMPGGPEKLAAHWAVTGPVLDVERLADITETADQLDDLIANRGLVLSEPVVVLRGAYLPGVTFEQLQDMQYEGPNGEPPAVYEEKGFTSTMLGDANGRAKSYPALGKWESLYQRYGSGGTAAHQDEVGTAIQFHITLPAGTKVASVEAARRTSHEFPRKPIVNRPKPPDVDPEYWTETDYEGIPTLDTRDLARKEQRSESEILLGSGARFRITKVLPGYTYHTSDPTLKPVQTVVIHMEYIGGGSSDGSRQ